MTKTIVVSLRIKPNHLAYAIDGLKHYDKNFSPDRVSEIVKQTFYHGLNYLTTPLPPGASQQSINRINQLTGQKTSQAEKIIGTPITHTIQNSKQDMLRAFEQHKQLNKASIEKEPTSESKINTVTDFAPSNLTKDIINEED